ncbi:uncharacterized protein M6B38_268675 [Iris pallida]|uniref:SLH domain-containing protein n=1 Tax=Iris pallida TaxID=29817 RepID=A0AAX6IBT9_IRIPA|nr:uncharacterized protein M6B38_268675 [Iris pallida]
MATMANLSSPSSLQLRFGRRCGGSSSLVPLRIRLRPPVPRIRLVAAGRGGRRLRIRGNASPDSFAGWSEESGDGGEPESKKGGFGGMLGAGLAGVLFAAGVTFASLSLSSRNTPGAKQQMKSPISEQEVILTSDDQGEKVVEDGNKSNTVLWHNGSNTVDTNSESWTGTEKDLFPNIENIEDATGSGLDNVYHPESSLILSTKPKDNNIDMVHGASIQDELQTSLDFDENPVSSSQNLRSTDLFTYNEAEFPSDTYTFKDSHQTLSFDSPDSSIGNDVKSTVDDVNLSSVITDSTVHTSDYQDKSLCEEDLPLDFASNHILGSSNEDSQVSSREVVDTAASVLEDQDMEHSETLEVPAEASSLNPEVRNIVRTVPSSTISAPNFDQNEAFTHPKEAVSPFEGQIGDSALPEAYSVSGLADPNENEPVISSHIQIGRSSISETVLPERSVSYAGIPAPSLVSAALQVTPGKVLVPPVVDQVQGQALSALQVLKVIEPDAQPGDLCTRREYARWLVSASSALSRSTISKVYPAMYIENVTELAFDDVTPEDPDFSFIQGLAEAGIISSKLSTSDFNGSSSGQQDSFLFSPESPVSRQDLVSWKMALETRQLPEVDKNYLYQCSGYIDIDKIDPNAWPALVADLSSGEQGITVLAFGYTRLFQPNKPVTKAQAAIALATGDAADIVGEELTRIEAESLAETAVNAHAALVAQVEKDINASFEKELIKEREKIDAMEKLAEEARWELKRLKAEREEENNALIRGKAAVESEMEVLSRLRNELQLQLQDLMSSKAQLSFEKDTINKLRKEAESENQVIVQLQYELEVERKALSMARTWAEEEAKRAREHARALEEARERWERHGIKVVVDGDLQDDASSGTTWLNAGKQPPVDETVTRAENLVMKLKEMASKIKLRSSVVIETIIQKIVSLISVLKQRASEASKLAAGYHSSVVSNASRSIEELKETASEFSSTISDKTRRAVEDCKGTVDKFTQKFKT